METANQLYVAIDTETTGLNAYKGAKPFAIIWSDPRDPSNISYADLREEGDENLMKFHKYRHGASYAKIFHNAKFDIQMLAAINQKILGPIHDTLIMAHIYNPDEPSKKLKVLAKKYLGIEADDEKAIKDWMKKNKCPNEYAKVPKAIMEPYAKNDVDITYKLFEFYKDKGVLDDPIYKLEMKLLRALIRMQQRGVPIDLGYCAKTQKFIEEKLLRIHNEIIEEYGDFNYNSNKQLGEFLFDKEGLTCDAMSAAGNPVLDANMLSKYEHPILPKVLEVRELSKLQKTYFEGIAEATDEDSVIHCDLYQVGAKTGRFSCRQPNLQNISNHTPEGLGVRDAFVCREDFSNYYFDYSQVELRVLAHYSKDKHMIDTLCGGGDLHDVSAEGIFGPDFNKENRLVAKKINFGIVYGIGPKKLAEMLNRELDRVVTYSEAFSYINKYHATYPMVKPLIFAVQRKILQQGYVTDIFGRKYPCPRDMAYKAVNYLIQGCSAGILKNAMLKVDELLLDKQSNMLLCVHDEIIVEIHKDEEELVAEIQKLMEDRNTFRVPILADIEKTSTNWSQKEEVSV